MHKNINRTIDRKLLGWKNSKNRRPLLIRGARQVGKTWSTRRLGESFPTFLEINLETQVELHSIFNEFFGEPNELIRQLSLVLGTKITQGQTLLFLDEIQTCPKALLSLRYFFEKLPEQHVVATGSLLEFLLKEVGMPVGRVEYLHLYPLSFTEFLIACGELALLELKETPISHALHMKFLKYLKTYFFLGGMPSVVREYLESGDLVMCSKLQSLIIANYRDDFKKYANFNRLIHLQKILDSVPRLLGEKFKYVNVSEELAPRELSQALEMLILAGVIYRCHHTSGNGVPLRSELNVKKFKIFFLDIGLALKILGIRISDFPLLSLDDLISKGGIAEQFVAQQIMSQSSDSTTNELYYWHREEKSAAAEVDFLVENGQSIIPIEVKSGVNKGKKSLSIFMAEKKCKLGYLFSLDEKVINDKNGITYKPLYQISDVLRWGANTKVGT